MAKCSAEQKHAQRQGVATLTINSGPDARTPASHPDSTNSNEHAKGPESSLNPCKVTTRSARRRAERGMAAYWDAAAHRYDAGHMIGNLPAWHAALCACLGSDKDAAIVDVATGTGLIACTIGECGYSNVMGVDLSEQMMRIASARAHEKGLAIPFILGNAVELPLQDVSADVIVSCRLLWTLHEPHAALDEWKRVLKPGGRIVAINEFDGKTIGCRQMTAYCENTSIDSFPWADASKEQIVTETTAHGFTQARIEHMPGCRLAASERENWHALIAVKPCA